jgi:OmpA-OmpF porin, OOP family
MEKSIMQRSTYGKQTFAAVFFSIGLAVLLLAGCSNGVEQIEKARNLNVTSEKANRFKESLVKEYRALAIYESDLMGDIPDAAKYAEKAIQAADGLAPGPDRLRSRTLPSELLKDIRPLRKRLLAVDVQSTNPEKVARAQASFDCWLEQLEEGFQPEHIAACRKRFLGALLETEAKLPEAFVTFFDSDGVLLIDDGVAAAARVAQTVKETDGFNILLSGHADREGATNYNQQLSEQRATVVRDQLIKVGIDQKYIRTVAFGETQPLIETHDGVPMRKNRRVEIAISLEAQE